MHSFPTADRSTLRSSSLPARAAASLVALGVGVIGLPASAHAQCPVFFAPAVNYESIGGPIAVAVGDFNADGRVDVQVANRLFGTVRCFLSSASGTFTTTGEINVGTTPRSIAVGDFNGDGRPDFVTANEDSNNISIRLGLGSGFTSGPTNYAVGTFPYSVAVGDFNADGRLDVAAANSSSNNVSVLLGNGSGLFTPAVNYAAGAYPASVAVGDFNGDGLSDLAVANNSSNNVSVLLGNGNGTFAAAVNYGAGSSPVSVAVGDFNGDGRADLAMANRSSNNVSVRLGNGNGTFAAAVNFAVGTDPWSVAVGDFNGDGLADLATANNDSNNVSVRLGNGNGTFAAAVNFAVGTGPYSVAVGDFNGDGRPDLAVANYDSQNVSVLLNSAPGNPLPVFTVHPVGQVAQAGASVSLTASANFTQGASPYRWLRNGQPLSNGGNISGATTTTLTINPVTASDEAAYALQATASTCLGVQTTTATSNTAVLAVVPPVVPVTPANNACSAATTISDGTFSFSTVGATTDGPTETNLGFCCGDLQINQDVWFKYTATCSGVATVSLCGSDFDSKVAIYTGTTCPAAPNTALAGNDDSGVCGNTNSHATFSTVAGRQYLIRVGGYNGAVGTVAMAVSCDGSACLAADMGVQGGIPGRDNLLDNNDFIVFIDNFFNQTGCP